ILRRARAVRRSGRCRRLLARLLAGPLARGLGLLAVVRRVETGSLERDGGRREHLAQLASAHRADGERFVAHGLNDVERMTAVAAPILVRGHDAWSVAEGSNRTAHERRRASRGLSAVASPTFGLAF